MKHASSNKCACDENATDSKKLTTAKLASALRDHKTIVITKGDSIELLNFCPDNREIVRAGPEVAFLVKNAAGHCICPPVREGECDHCKAKAELAKDDARVKVYIKEGSHFLAADQVLLNKIEAPDFATMPKEEARARFYEVMQTIKARRAYLQSEIDRLDAENKEQIQTFYKLARYKCRRENCKWEGEFEEVKVGAAMNSAMGVFCPECGSDIEPLDFKPAPMQTAPAPQGGESHA